MAKVVGTKCRRNIAENLNRLSRAHERYRRQTDGRAIAYSVREREFTFAKNQTFVDHILLETSQVSDRYRYISFMQSRCKTWLIFPSDYLVSFYHIPSNPLMN